MGHIIPGAQYGAIESGMVTASVPRDELQSEPYAQSDCSTGTTDILLAITLPSISTVFESVNPEPVIKMVVPTLPELGEREYR